MQPRLPASLVLAALLLASPALSGCLGTAQATAKDHRSTAEDRASDWAGSPRLIEAIGVEGSFPTSFGASETNADQQADYWSKARDDPDVGDGHAEIWVYRFVSEEMPGTVLTVVVDKDGEVVHTHRADRAGDEAPIGEWEVGSDEAIETAKEANQGLREGTDKEHFGLVMRLAEDDDHDNPVWLIAGGGGDRSGGGGGVVTLDAVTGEVLSSSGGYRSTG